MDKWEYCYFDISKSLVVNFKNEKTESIKIKKEKKFKDKSKEDACGRTISKLGLEGWELVNCMGNTAKVFYFKRKIS